MDKDFDYSEFKDAPEDDLMAEIAEAAKAQIELRVEVEDLDDKLKAKKAELLNNEQFLLPDLFDKGRLEGTITTAGYKIPLRETIRASVAKDNFEGMKWLEDNGQGRIVKLQVIVDFDSMDKEAFEDFKTLLTHRGETYKIDRSVHSMSLQSAVKQLMEEGVDVPQKTLNVWRQRICKVKV